MIKNEDISMYDKDGRDIRTLKASDIILKFPEIYGKPPYDPMENLLCFGFDCGPGWYPLILDLSEKIQAVLDKYPGSEMQVTQVKEKYGSLRFYESSKGDKSFHDEIDRLIDEAETRSETICEVCGDSAVPGNREGWITTRCDKCS